MAFAAVQLIDIKRDETLPANLPPDEFDSGGRCRPWCPLSMFFENKSKVRQVEKKYQESLKNRKTGVIASAAKQSSG
jgi:hypothetical protein